MIRITPGPSNYTFRLENTKDDRRLRTLKGVPKSPDKQPQIAVFPMSKPKNKLAAVTTTITSRRKGKILVHRSPNLEWAKNPSWTWTLITYLTDHPDFRQRIFSDATPNVEGRMEQIGKHSKAQQYAILAETIFSKEPTQDQGFKANPRRYATSVETRLRRLKKEYAEHTMTLGVEANLPPDKVAPGTPLANMIMDIATRWPWWAKLHAFWRELPSHNPMAATSSTPGHDHAVDPANGDGVSVENELSANRSDEDDANGQVFEDGYKQQRDQEQRHELQDDALGLSTQSKVPAPSAQSPFFVGATTQSSSNTPNGWITSFTKSQSTAGTNSSGIVVSTVAKDKNVVPELRSAEAHRIERKRQMNHELSMAHAANKRLKYEFKYEFKKKTLAADHEVRLKKIEADHHLEALKLQLELERLRTSRLPVLDAAPAPTAQLPLPGALSDRAAMSGTSENASISHRSSTLAPLQEAILKSSDLGCFPLTPFDTLFSSALNEIYHQHDDSTDDICS